MPQYITPPPVNPLSRLLAGIFAVLALAGAFFFGIFVLALVAGLGLIAWLVFSIRIWWIRRKFAADGYSAGPEPGTDKSDIIDAEYTVLSRKDED